MTIQDPGGSKRGPKAKQAARRGDRDRKGQTKQGQGPDKGGDGAGRRTQPKPHDEGVPR